MQASLQGRLQRKPNLVYHGALPTENRVAASWRVVNWVADVPTVRLAVALVGTS